LPAIQGLSDMRDRRVEILFDHLRVLTGPEDLCQDVLRHSAMFACRDITENISGPPGRPGIRSKWFFRIAQYFWMTQNANGKIRNDRRGRGNRGRKGGFVTFCAKLFLEIRWKAFVYFFNAE